MTGFDSKRQAALDKLFEVENELGLHYDQRTPMTKDEALKLALDALTYIHTETSTEEDVLIDEAITAIKEALAQPAQEPDCYDYAARLATAIWKQHYKKTAPEWQVLDSLIGVLTQIDNMTAGLISPSSTAEQRPWVGLTDDELVQIGVATGLERAAAQMIESKLKEGNT
jgi:hypothetical protein